VNKRFLISLAVFMGLPLIAFAMTSTNYEINWDSINIGGTDTSTSTNYLLRDTIGEYATGVSTSTNYEISAGYRAGGTASPSLSFEVGTLEDGAETTWSAFSEAGNTVTVTTSSVYAVGDYIAVVENVGFAQIVAVGKVTDVTGSTVTVDDWEGEPSSLSASPSGSDDYTYRLGGSSADLGMQSIVTENTSITVTNVVSNASNGYTVTIEGRDALHTTLSTIEDVSDGAVTAGSEEYGIESIGTHAANPGTDVAIPVLSTRVVQQDTAPAANDRVAIVYKLSVNPSTPTGDYTQKLVYRLTGNF
jgi:hypothetical protein